MAKKRMFDSDVVDTDLFLDMPQGARLLYYDLGMRADDDGFISNPKKIMKMTNASDDDLKILILKKFLIAFENGIVVIRHWKLNNYLRGDRYKRTIYTKEKARLIEDNNGIYSLGIPNGNQRYTIGIPPGIPSIEENRIEENRVVEDIYTTTNEDSKDERYGNREENSFKSERYGNREENLFEFIEKSFGRPLSSAEYEIVITWDDNDLTRYAIKQAELSRAFNIKYVNQIISSYKKEGIKCIADAEERDRKFREKKNKSSQQRSKIPAGYEEGKIYEEAGIKFKYNSSGKREIL